MPIETFGQLRRDFNKSWLICFDLNHQKSVNIILTNLCQNSFVSFCDKERMMNWFAKMIFDGGGGQDSKKPHKIKELSI